VQNGRWNAHAPCRVYTKKTGSRLGETIFNLVVEKRKSIINLELLKNNRQERSV
jgi:hypothetical protein